MTSRHRASMVHIERRVDYIHPITRTSYDPSMSNVHMSRCHVDTHRMPSQFTPFHHRTIDHALAHHDITCADHMAVARAAPQQSPRALGPHGIGARAVRASAHGHAGRIAPPHTAGVCSVTRCASCSSSWRHPTCLEQKRRKPVCPRMSENGRVSRRAGGAG